MMVRRLNGQDLGTETLCYCKNFRVLFTIWLYVQTLPIVLDPNVLLAKLPPIPSLQTQTLILPQDSCPPSPSKAPTQVTRTVQTLINESPYLLWNFQYFQVTNFSRPELTESWWMCYNTTLLWRNNPDYRLYWNWESQWVQMVAS